MPRVGRGGKGVTAGIIKVDQMDDGGGVIGA